MPGEDFQSWSTTAINNGTADSSMQCPEGMARAAVNDWMRSCMAALAKYRNLTNGSITTGGTANAQTFTSGVGYVSVPTGLIVVLKIGTGLSNTAAVTLNMDSIGAVTVKSQAGLDLAAGMLAAGTYATVLYNGANWILISRGVYVVNVQTF